MTTTQSNLPDWAELKNENGLTKVLVDIDRAYPAYLAELGMSVNQYSVGLAQQCCMKEITELMGGKAWIRLYSKTNSETYKVTNLPIHTQYMANGDAMSRQMANSVWLELKQKREHQ